MQSVRAFGVFDEFRSTCCVRDESHAAGTSFAVGQGHVDFSVRVRAMDGEAGRSSERVLCASTVSACVGVDGLDIVGT